MSDRKETRKGRRKKERQKEKRKKERVEEKNKKIMKGRKKRKHRFVHVIFPKLDLCICLDVCGVFQVMLKRVKVVCE